MGREQVSGVRVRERARARERERERERENGEEKVEERQSLESHKSRELSRARY